MNNNRFKADLNRIIFGTDTPAGRLFDEILIWAIVISVLALMLESVQVLNDRFGEYFVAVEWFFTLAFTVEYLLRIYCSPQRLRYIGSFYGVVDLVSILPSYLGLLFPGASYILIVRLLRVLRIFRIFKLGRYLSEANVLVRSLMLSRRKIVVFFFGVLVLATVFGSVMFVVEGPANGFTSIPKSIYWTVVTITTVGYGDITPQTVLGQIVATAAMLTGYSIIAVPTGIVTAELTQELQRERQRVNCRACRRSGHDSDAYYCKHCGTNLG